MAKENEPMSQEKIKAIVADRRELSRQIYASLIMPAYLDLRKGVNAKVEMEANQLEILRSKWRGDCMMAAAQAMEAAKVFQETWNKKKAMFIPDPS
jgi:hypothetical protein